MIECDNAADIVWRPKPSDIAAANVTDFMAWLSRHRGITVKTWDELWAWSVRDLAAFWSALWSYYRVIAERGPDQIVSPDPMPGARWFDGARLNYAENILARAPRDRAALIEVAEDQPPRRWSTEQITGMVGALSHELTKRGVRPGDRVAGYLPNVPEAVIALLATAAIGAVWSSCGPEFGTSSVIDRFGQIEPSVLLVVDGYRYGGNIHDRRDAIAEIRAQLPSVHTTIMVRKLQPEAPLPLGTLAFEELVATPRPPVFTAVLAGHPLWVLFTSGSTGRPKGIVHSHGGIVLEHLKSLGLCLDVGPADTMFFASSTSWMAWNYGIGALLHGASVVLSCADPARPRSDGLFAVAAQTGTTVLGLGSAYITSLAKQNMVLRDRLDLSALRLVMPTGSPLPPAGWRWLARELDARVDSICGGTEVCTVFFCGNPLTAVHAGRISGCSLGVEVQAWDHAGRPQCEQLGEMIVTTAMPSMPLFLWGDVDHKRYRETYFETYPGVWCQGDWVIIERDGSVAVAGRSDATLNRGGVRLGSAEVYAVVDRSPRGAALVRRMGRYP
ncbi:acetoacetate--CoA ligase [[Mycobacterium] fortunisiensis]|uniref:acetoacetate--CoA ligase n=1 Tax=[Mycobacterium] fortunisiensis TaxID=2600579 RepID=UPI001C3FD556|nr:acetoacetate--CoA ligase [[Mycobacterium] fortunisiensis]